MKMVQGNDHFTKHNNKNQLVLQLVVVAVVLFLLSLLLYYSSGLCLPIQPLDIFFSACLYIRTLERKHMFLICNGILVFLATNFASCTSSSSASHLTDELNATTIQGESRIEFSKNDVAFVVEQAQERNEDKKNHSLFREDDVHEEKEKGSLIFVAEAEVKEAVKNRVWVKPEDTETQAAARNEYPTSEEAAEESVWLKPEDTETQKAARNKYPTSKEAVEDRVWVKPEDTETQTAAAARNEDPTSEEDELKKKFDDFIRKMKEEIRIVAV